MLQKLSHGIVKNYKITLIIFTVLFIAACVGAPFVVKRLNSEVMSYLPADTETVEGLSFLKDNFGISADAMFGVQGATGADLTEIADKLDRLYYDDSGKKRSFFFDKAYDDDTRNGRGFYYATDEEIEGGISDKKVITQCLWRNADFVATYEFMYGGTERCDEVIDLFYNDNDTPTDLTDDVYVFMLNINFGSSDSETFKVLDMIQKDIVGDRGEYYAFGSTVMAKDIFENTIGEVWVYTLTGLGIILIVLFLFTKSWMDPVIMLLTLGISIVLNIGSNVIFQTNSVITFATSALLQMALSIDYSVFLINAYRDEMKYTLDPKEALEKAIPRTFKSVFASAMTTVGGFTALFFMRFGIGADMGAVLAKGILLSFIGVLFLQPALMIILRKPLERSQHRELNLKFRKPIKTVIKYRSVVIALFLILIFPVVLYQADLPLNYFNFVEYEEKDGRLYDMVDIASRQLIVAVPIDIDNEDSVKAQYKLCTDLRALKEKDETPSITFILGINSLIPEDGFADIMDDSFLRKVLIDNSGSLINNGYTIYTIGLSNNDVESEAAFATVAEIEKTVQGNFEGKNVYVTGLTQAGRDFEEITPNDFQRVTIASVLIIIAVLLLTFRSVKHSFILILLIEFGIWVNLGIQKLTGDSINFMSYIIISSMQLGATVDYAILITSKYREYRKRMLPAHAAYQATTSSVMAVLTSATILAGACFCVKLMSTVLIVAEVCSLVARGAIISAVLTIFVLPAILSFFDRPSKGKTMDVPPQDKLSKHVYNFEWLKRLKNKNVKNDNADSVVSEKSEEVDLSGSVDNQQ